MAKKKQYKRKPSTKLMGKHYPIGWGTGLDEAEWRAFAEQYKPKQEERVDKDVTNN